jgi:hypothetical protein
VNCYWGDNRPIFAELSAVREVRIRASRDEVQAATTPQRVEHYKALAHILADELGLPLGGAFHGLSYDGVERSAYV